MTRSMYSRIFIVALAFCTVLSWGISKGEASSYKKVRDWDVFCDQALICTMAAYPSSSNLIYSFELERGTEAHAPLKLRISMNGSPNEETDILIDIPGELDNFYLPVRDGSFKDATWSITSDDLIGKLLPAMKKGSVMRVGVETNKAAGTQEISLSGVVGALLYLDESQGRLDHEDALQAKGTLPAKQVQTRVVILKSQDDLPAPVRTLWESKHDYCSDEERDLIAQYEAFSVNLGEDGALYFLPCGGPGAYNFPSALYVHFAKENAARSVSFPTLGSEGPTNTSTAYNLSWNDKTSTLSAFFKGRGIGDCGTKQKWKWRDANNVYGELELIEERVKGDCDGKDGEFPLLWPPD